MLNFFLKRTFNVQGIEGRSSNPVSVLFDALAHPDADLGNEQPSLLEWKLQNELALDHVVLGSGMNQKMVNFLFRFQKFKKIKQFVPNASLFLNPFQIF